MTTFSEPVAADLAPLEPDAQVEPALEPQVVEVRRNPVVAGLVGAGAAGMATAYLGRAVSTGGLLDWVLCAALAVLAVGFLRSLLDSRTPLLVLDELGVRARLGSDWRGVAWDAVDRVAVTPRRGLLRDGRIAVTLLDPVRATDGLARRALRHAQLNRRMYGAALAAPLGLTTRVSGEGDQDLRERVAGLSRGRTEVVTLLGAPGQVLRPPEPAAPATAPATALAAPTTRSGADDLGGSEDETAGEQPRRRGRRTVPFRVVDTGEAVAARVHAEEAGPVEARPARDPLIGPELAAARTRVGLSVDELADRTRIRPHVIESIEVDDFSACGGDFYTRGHIRTLARVLGKDPAPLLATFEQRYATGPVSARRVFEAELATGITGTVRGGSLGGPNWLLLVGVVLALVLVWSGVRLFAGAGDEVLETPPPLLNGSAELASGFEAPAEEAVPLTVAARNASAAVEVLDGEGEVLFEGDLAPGTSKKVTGVPPLTVAADNGAAVTVVVAGRQAGALGQGEGPATRVYQAPTD